MRVKNDVNMKTKGKKRILLVALVMLMAVLLAGCGGAADETGAKDGMRTVTDSEGRQVEIPEKVEKVACIGVGALRYTCYMDAVDLVAGVEDYEKEQAISRPYNYINYDVFKELPVIGVKDEPNPELLIEAAPDVIMMSMSIDMEADELQSKTGIPVVKIPHNDSMMDENAYETFELMGEVYGKGDRARELMEYMDEVKADLDERTGAIKDKDKDSVYIGGVSYRGAHGFDGTEAFYGPVEAINGMNLANETGQEGPFNIDLEQVLLWDPDVIFIDLNGMMLIQDHYSKNPDYYNQLSAVKKGKVYSQISFRSSASNLDTALADAYYAGTVLYPKAFSDIDPAEKTDEIFRKLLGSDFYDTLKENGYEFKEITLGQE